MLVIMLAGVHRFSAAGADRFSTALYYLIRHAIKIFRLGVRRCLDGLGMENGWDNSRNKNTFLLIQNSEGPRVHRHKLIDTLQINRRHWHFSKQISLVLKSHEIKTDPMYPPYWSYCVRFIDQYCYEETKKKSELLIYFHQTEHNGSSISKSRPVIKTDYS